MMFWENKIYKRFLRKEKRDGFQENTDEKSLKNKRLFSRMLFYFLVFLFCGVNFYVFFFSYFLKVDKILINGIEEIDSQAIENEIIENFSKKRGYFFPGDNFILIYSKDLAENLQNKFPKIKTIKVKKIFPNEIKIFITERKALFIWCRGDFIAEEIEQGKNNDCFLVDDEGYVYTSADFNLPEVKENNLIKIYDGSRREISLGEKIISEEFLRFTFEIKNLLQSNLEIKIKNYYHTPSRFSQEIKIQTEEGWWLYFSTNFPAIDAVKTLKLFLEKENNINLADIEYIDLRMENKIYYKLKTPKQNKNN